MVEHNGGVQEVVRAVAVKGCLERLRSLGEAYLCLFELVAEFEKCREAFRRQWADLDITSEELQRSLTTVDLVESHITEYAGRNNRAISGGAVPEVETPDQGLDTKAPDQT